ncbi:MAG TPA: HEAT repeat domain-containing protein, partial [Gemmataceae bacterium]
RKTKEAEATKAIPALTKCLEDKDAEIRGDACQTLAEIAFTNKLACPLPVLQALFDPVADVRGTAATYVEVYDKYPDGALKLALRAMTHEDVGVRANIPTVVAKIGGKDKEVLVALRKATEDKEPQVRHNAFIALWNVTKDLPLLVPHLLESVEDAVELGAEKENETPEMKSRRTIMELIAVASATKLRELGETQTADLARVLIKRLTDKSARLRRLSARALGATAMIGDDAKAIVKELKADKELLKLFDDSDEDVRAEAKAAVKRIAE